MFNLLNIFVHFLVFDTLIRTALAIGPEDKLAVKKLKNEIFEFNKNIKSTKEQIVNSAKLKMENDQQMEEHVDDSVREQFEGIARMEVIAEQLHQFVGGLEVAGIAFLEKKLRIIEYLRTKLKGIGIEENQIVKCELAILEQYFGTVEQLYKRIIVKGKDRIYLDLDKSELVAEQQVADQKVQLELITMLQESNLHTTVEYEKMMAELAKPTLAKRELIEMPTDLAQHVHKMFWHKLIGQLNDSMKPILEEIESTNNLVTDLAKNLEQVETGNISKNAIKDHSESMFKMGKEHENDGNRGKDRQREKCREHYEEWLKGNLQFLKTAYGRMFLPMQLTDAQKEIRRRRRRGEDSPPESPASRFNWRLWAQCAGSVLLVLTFIALILLIIVGLVFLCVAAAEGGPGGCGDVFCFGPSSGGYGSSSSAEPDFWDSCSAAWQQMFP